MGFTKAAFQKASSQKAQFAFPSFALFRKAKATQIYDRLSPIHGPIKVNIFC